MEVGDNFYSQQKLTFFAHAQFVIMTLQGAFPDPAPKNGVWERD